MTKPGDSPTSKGTCITAEMRKDRTPLEAMKRRAQEAEGELSIMKGIETNRVKEAQARSNQLQDELDRVKKENNDLYNKIADLTESLKSKDYFEKPDYKFLVDENHRLEQQYLEVMADNKKLSHEIEDRVNRMRKAGM
jgi:predicted RNase H-like nuclease (RuvC/YqgF family)